MCCLKSRLALGQNGMLVGPFDDEDKQIDWLFVSAKYLCNENDTLLV